MSEPNDDKKAVLDPDFIPADAVKDYIAIRDLKEQLTAAYKRQMDELDAALGNIEAGVLNYLEASGLKSIKTENGTAFKKVTTSAKINDRAAFLAWLQKTKKFDLVTLTCNKKELTTMLFDGDKPRQGVTEPPGVKLDRWFDVQVRRADNKVKD